MGDGSTPERRGGPLVLVADDDPAVRALAEAMLVARGADVLLACDGVAAVELCRMRTPDLVLLDLHMPVASGFDVVRALRADARTASLRVVAMTTMPLDLVAAHGDLLGCDVLAKADALRALGRLLQPELT